MRSDRTRDHRVALPRTPTRETITIRGRTYRLRGSETELLETLGTFRAVFTSDLAREPDADPVRLRQDIDALTAQHLVVQRTITRGGQPASVLALTDEGRALLVGAQVEKGPDAQQFHAGLRKPRELEHDATLYRMAQEETRRLERDGGRVTRVILDVQLKREYQRAVNRETDGNGRVSEDVRRARRQEFADAHDLAIVNDRLQLPDVRLEYETEDGRTEHRDLELVTDDYRAGHLAAKQRAGFTLYRTSHGTPGVEPYDPHLLRDLV